MHSDIFSSFSKGITWFNFSLKMASKCSNKDREEHGDKRVKVTVPPHDTVEGI